MRTRTVLLFLLLAFLCGAIQAQNRPVDNAARVMNARAEHSFPMPVARQKVDPAEVKAEADQLARLAQLIPSQITQIEHGMLPKDLDQNLKQIEKLTKHLRRELNF